MDVTISRSIHDAIVAAAAANPANEVCGLLFGTPARIDAVRDAPNVSPRPQDSFEIDPAALIAAHRAARNGGPALVGHYHSHPSGRAIPSARDAAASTPDGALWLIVAGPDVRAWRAVCDGAVEGRFDPVALTLSAACAETAARSQGSQTRTREIE